jgi:hypothetical protein
MKHTHSRILLLVAALVLVVYAGSLSHEFTGDDVALFLQNDFYAGVENIPVLLTPDFLTTYEDLDAASPGQKTYSGFVGYRPVTALSFFADHWLWGQAATGYHLDNILLHILAVGFVYVLLLRLLGSGPVALLAALLFALHPVQTEAVNTIGYRSDLLVTIFYLASFLTFVRFRERLSSGRWLVLSLAFFVMALFSKETAVTLPVMLAGYEWLVRRGRPGPASPRETVSAIFPYILFSAVLAFYLYVYFIVFPNTTLTSPVALPAAAKAALFIRVFSHYIFALLWPFGISVVPPLYWPSTASVPLGEGLLAGGFFLASITAGVLLRKRTPAVTFFIVWFYLAYLPAANLIPSPNPLAYRLLYLPSIGFFAVLALAVEALTGRLKQRAPGMPADLAVKALIIASYAALTIQVNMFFRTNETLCREMIRRYPQASRPFWILGLTALESRQYDKAIGYFRGYLKAEKRNPFVRNAGQDYFIHHQLGRCYVEDPHQAIAQFRRAVSLRPDYTAAYADLAKAHLLAGEPRDALAAAIRTIELDAGMSIAYVYAAHGALELGDRESAEEFLRKGLSVAPDDQNLLYLKQIMGEK